jgi:hypothetical protein
VPPYYIIFLEVCQNKPFLLLQLPPTACWLRLVVLPEKRIQTPHHRPPINHSAKNNPTRHFPTPDKPTKETIIATHTTTVTFLFRNLTDTECRLKRNPQGLTKVLCNI